jgi:hypothetical protein
MAEDETVWCWFDIVILDNPESTVPKVKNGVTLVARSHGIAIKDTEPTFREGKVFGRQSDFLGMLDVRQTSMNERKLDADEHPRSEM